MSAVRQLTYAQAICEATAQLMAADENVYVMGLGATDPKAIFGTTLGLAKRFPARVFDMPVAENGMTGVGVGAALGGMRPIMVHQRIDFAGLALDQILNNAAKWHYMFGNRQSVPLVIRLIIGRGWGQGPQHSQSLQATFAHIPGLKVVMPATPRDAKGLLIASVEDPNPVIFIEHRWLHETYGNVPEERYDVPIGVPNVVRRGSDVTIAATSLGVLDALKAAEVLARDGIEAEVIDVRTLKPLDFEPIAASIRNTGHFVAVDSGWKTLGFAGELLALASESCHDALRAAPRRVTSPDGYVPTSHALADAYYTSALSVANAVEASLGRTLRSEAELGLVPAGPRDVPDSSFRGPF